VRYWPLDESKPFEIGRCTPTFVDTHVEVDDISMDFIVSLPLTARKKDSIWVIVDRLTNTAHFIAVHTTYSVQQYTEIYMEQIFRLHGIPKTIISDRGTQFVACFWEKLHECLGTKLIVVQAIIRRPMVRRKT
jgi:IS30 family transposase